MKNKKRIKKYLILAILLILISLLIIFIPNKNNKIVKIIGDNKYQINITGSINVDTTKTITEEPNVPVLGAGMIPIKYVDGVWQITSTDDTEWYDYANGKMATVMLSDGYYVSEPKQNLVNQEVVPTEGNMPTLSEETTGTIYVWIPRLVYTDEEIMYLKGISVVETDKFTLPGCYTYRGSKTLELSVEGVWVEQTPQGNTSETATKIAKLSAEENEYGLIKNEVVESLGGEANIIVEKLQKGQAEQKQQVKDIKNLNRTMIKVVDTNKITPIIGSSYIADGKVYIEVTYSKNIISKIVNIEDGVVLSELSNFGVMDVPINGIYTYAMIDTEGNIKTVSVQVGDGTPELIGFKVNTTYIVMYDSSNNEYSTIPIQEILKDGYEVDSNNALKKGTIDFRKLSDIESSYEATWYNYNSQKWANIVVRNNANVAYFTWIPRYVYKLNNDEQSTQITFVNTYNQDKNGNEMDLTEWTLPEAFIWQKDDGEKVQIPGYWMGKYALSNSVSLNLKANIVGGINKIRVNNITNASGLANVKYDIYLYEAGEESNKILSAKTNGQLEKTKVEPGDEVDLIQNAVGGGTYSFNKSVKTQTDVANTLEAGNYAIRIVIKDSAGVYRGENWFTTAVENTTIAAEMPDLTGYRVNTTYIVTYTNPSDESTMNASIPISSILANGYEVDPVTNTLVNGHVDESKVRAVLAETGATWYDYNTQKWANIVVRNAGSESYYTWIPRYVYRLDTVDQTTEIKFISTSSDIASGWTLPEAFTWVDETGATKQINGYWIGKYALSPAVNLNFKIDNGDKAVGGTNKIAINNISCSLSNITYRIYVYDHAKETTDKYFAEPETIPGEKRAFNDYDCSNNRYVRYCEMKPADTKTVTFYGLGAGTYDVRIVAYDSRGYYRAEKWYNDIEVIDTVEHAEIPDLTGYRVNTTYIVVYTDPNDANTMDASIPISSILSDGYEVDPVTNTLVNGRVDENKVKQIENSKGAIWYDYNNQKWANIVVRNAGSESYYTWIPRYVYKLDTVRQTTEVQYASINDSVASGWTLPEAFTWVDETGATKQLNGYWIGKYALSPAVNLNFKIDNGDKAVGGTNKIAINNISCSLSNITYRIYVYDHAKETTDKYFAEPETIPGEKRAFNDYDCSNNRYVRYCEMKPEDTKTVTFYGLGAGTYDVRIVAYDSRGYYRAEKWYNDIEVIDTVEYAQIPDLTGYRVNTTYMVIYTDPNDANTMDASIPISSILSDGYEVDPVTNTLVNGRVDENKVKQIENSKGAIWYDYNNQKWANIVVRNAGSESYYTWIPRYVYKLDTVRQTTEVQYASINDSVPSGWTLPEAFTWIDETGATKQLNGYWIGKYALSYATALNFKIDNGDKALGGTNKIIINNVSSSLSNVTYKVYVYDHAKELTDEFFAEPETTPGTKRAFNDYDCSNNRYVRYCEMKPSDTKSVIFYGLGAGTYDVRIAIFDSRGYYRAEKWYKNVEVINEVDPGRASVNDVIKPGIEEAVHTGFNQNTTYYVTYDSSGRETLTPITQNPPSNWYDYSSQKWANIVTKNNGKTAYFVWVPRYIYKLDTVRQSTEIKFIRVGDSIPSGWTMPEAFTWVDETGTTVQIEGYWMGKYALSN